MDFLENYNHEKNYIYFCLFNILFVLFWLFKFPVYRLGISQLYVMLISFCFIIFINNINNKCIINYRKYFNIFLIILVTSLLLKNLIRINENSNNAIFPNLFSDKDLIKVFNSEKYFTHYRSTDGECGYSFSPCTHYEKNLLLKEFFGYKIYSSKL